MRCRIRSLLEHAGLQVIGEAADGQELVEQALALTPDLIILDISMPVRSGLETANEVLRASPRAKLLVFTIHEAEEFRKEARRAGAQGYMLKGSSRAELLAEVKRLLGD
jgi:two-component system response regulator NreC